MRARIGWRSAELVHAILASACSAIFARQLSSGAPTLAARLLPWAAPKLPPLWSAIASDAALAEAALLALSSCAVVKSAGRAMLDSRFSWPSAAMASQADTAACSMLE